MPNYSYPERLSATVPHVAIIIYAAGWPAPLVGFLGYLIFRKRSPYIARQALQASVYQFLALVSVVALYVFGLTVVFPFLPDEMVNSHADSTVIFLGAITCLFMWAISWVGYGLYGALRVWSGDDFRYFALGRLFPDTQNTDQSD